MFPLLARFQFSSPKPRFATKPVPKPERITGVEIRIVESDLTDPAAGVDRGSVDVALTRGPFNATGVMVAEIRSDAVGLVVTDTDPLATRDREDRRWVRLLDTSPRFSRRGERPSRASWGRALGDMSAVRSRAGGAPSSPRCDV
ncbi:LysR substrate-binding domain-containing protein [Prauserella cavernicola]|uniref:LysR substrate-binding domain-containing protein n=1 Tax=Prauserella cavernicola TaxID=2800127 RepID=A0A934QXU8_9PSEU|nr:hypothetical protein [Prauserella cavernicola]